MDLELTTWERLTVFQLIGRLQGDAMLMYKASQLFDILELTEEEKAEINLHRTINGMEWDDPTRKWSLSFTDPEAVLMMTMAVTDNKHWVAGNAREIEHLHETLGLEWPPVTPDQSPPV